MRSTLIAVCLALGVSSGLAAERPNQPHLYPRSAYAWPFASGPAYGDVDAGRWSEPGVLHTMVGSFDLKQGSLPLPAELRAAPDSRYAILQVDPATYADGRFDRIRSLLEGQGGVLLEAMAVSAHVVHLTPSLQGLLRAQDGVLALEPYHPAFKLAPNIGRVPLSDPARATSDIYRLEAMVFRGESADGVAMSLRALGASITRVDPDVVFFELRRDRLADVARMDAVKAIFETLPNLMHGEESSAHIQTGSSTGGLPYNDAGIRGDGNGVPGASPQVLMMLDSGLQLDAGDLSDTRTSPGTAGPAHRKVLLYTTAVGGTGDALGCDASLQGGFTHGHAVAVTALGNASAVPPGYGQPWPDHLQQWALDGVAPRAKLLLYDAQVTSSLLSCADPMSNTLSVGTLYTDDTPGSGSLGDGYARGARVSNFSWGTVDNPVYGTNAQRIDQFLFDQPDAMVVVAAGDLRDYPSGQIVSDPATCKSCAVVGVSSGYGSGGPAASSNRLGILVLTNDRADHPTCRSTDNDQNSPVECDVFDEYVDYTATSYAAADVSGAALLVRDWFQQGFYPDGTSTNSGNAADQVPSISGALLKAVLVTGAVVDTNLFYYPAYRFNTQFGYGLLNLSRALPLNTYAPSPPGMIVADGGLPSGGRLDILGLAGSVDVAGTTQTGTLRIESDQSELHCALAWTEDAGDALAHDLDLELVSPSGKVYLGNFFTEDVDRDGALDAGENCIDRNGPNTLDQGAWSIEISNCGSIAASRRDLWNPTEGIFLSPDPVGDGIAQGTDNQIEVGDWSIKVIYRTGTGSQRYAVSCSGPIANGSSARFDRPSYVCSDQVTVTVQETTDPGDPSPSAAEVASRTTLQVVDGNGVVRDSESGPAFTAFGLRFVGAPVLVTAGTAYDPGNGVLDVRPGDRVRVIYADETGGAPDLDKARIGTAQIACRLGSVLGRAQARFGRDTADLILGGCERDARGLFTFGFPDQHMDAGETLAYRVGLQISGEDLRDLEVSLRCVKADGDSPAACPPGSHDCPDPDRLNNPPCTEMTVLDSPRTLPFVPGPVTATFSVRMAPTIVGTPKVDMLVGVTDRLSGKIQESLLAFRHVLDADDLDVFYSTDFPTGGTDYRDYNGNEILENPITNATDPELDYRFETRTFGDLTAGGTRNTALHAPWSFDIDDGGFRVGLNPTGDDVTTQVIANWGEDKNFNGVLDPGEDRDPVNGVLDRGWNTKGGCGWQTKGTGATGGIWHTGTIGETTLACPDQCKGPDSFTGNQSPWELLLTPVIEKVSPGLDADGEPTHRVALTNWAWNMALDLRNARFTWELDTDAASPAAVDLYDDQTLGYLHFNNGAITGGPLSQYLLSVQPVFAPFVGTASVNGTAGNNRVGKNACIFETALRQPDSTLDLTGPEDNDADDDGDGLIDELVAANGPLRNFDITLGRGFFTFAPDLRFQTLEDGYGDSGNSFQGALGFLPYASSTSYGVGIDDMVIEWKETSLVKDGTNCASGACATLSLDATHAYQGSGVLTVTVIDASPWEPLHPFNDCNGDGDYIDPGDDQDCNDNGTVDVTVRGLATGEPGGEIFALDRTTPGSAEWKGGLPFSSARDVPGTLYVLGPLSDSFGPLEVTARYEDRDDGTGQRCGNTADPALRGFLEETTSIERASPALVSVGGTRLADNGDNDGFADPNETVTMYISLHNNTADPRDGLVVHLSTNDPTIDCILSPVVSFGSLAAHETREAPTPFTFRVANLTRTAVDSDLTASFHVSVSGEDFDVPTRQQTLTLDLDLNVSGGLLPTSFAEGFEGAGFGTFTTQSLDVGRESLAASNGFRCQYNDPDFVSSNSYGNVSCFLGASLPTDNGYDWHVHGLASPDGGRAYLGSNSLHWGVHPGAPSADTTRLKQLDAIRTNLPINLGWNGVRSELSFKHEIGMLDSDYVGPAGYTVDRGIVQVQLANSAGQAVGNWRKISPYENLYDKQTTDLYSNCLFDPVDDGNTEDDYFDPSNPERRLGPSSTCYPEFVFARQGATLYTSSFDAADIGYASDGPGLQGSRGPGTWVQTKFDLSRYRGRRLRLRFLVSTIEISNAITQQQALGWNSCCPARFQADDGWYIDDVQVTNTTTSASLVTVDTANRTGLPGCGVVCGSVTAGLSALPPTTSAPGQLTQLSAASSFVDRCVDGILQFRFWEDRNGNAVVGDAGDLLLREWSENPILVQAPAGTTRYGVEVRCSSLPSCQASTTFLVPVTCPSTGNARAPFGQPVGFASKTLLSWPAAETVDVIRGDLGTLRSSAGQFNGTVEACLANDQGTSSVADPSSPGPGAGKYYLVRGAGPSPYCNATPTWKTGAAAEKPGAGGDRDVDLALDPDACP